MTKLLCLPAQQRRDATPKNKKTSGPPLPAEPEVMEYMSEVVRVFQSRLAEVMTHFKLSRRTLHKELGSHLGNKFTIKGMSQATVGRWLTEELGPRLAHIAILAEYLGTTVADLLDPSVPVSALRGSAAGKGESLKLSQTEAFIITKLVRQMGDDVAISRLVEARSSAPTSEQLARSDSRARPRTPGNS
jgi:transcriptional regulator with XRE-family HTH domain